MYVLTTFLLNDFSNTNTKDALLHMLELKKNFKNGRYEINDKELETVLLFKDYSDEETALIRKLFES